MKTDLPPGGDQLNTNKEINIFADLNPVLNFKQTFLVKKEKNEGKNNHPPS